MCELFPSSFIILLFCSPYHLQVNVGCVPKKVMFNTAMQAEHLRIMPDYGFRVKLEEFNFRTIKEKRDEYIRRLNAIYEGNLKKVGRLVSLTSVTQMVII